MKFNTTTFISAVAASVTASLLLDYYNTKIRKA